MIWSAAPAPNERWFFATHPRCLCGLSRSCPFELASDRLVDPQLYANVLGLGVYDPPIWTAPSSTRSSSSLEPHQRHHQSHWENLADLRGRIRSKSEKALALPRKAHPQETLENQFSMAATNCRLVIRRKELELHPNQP